MTASATEATVTVPARETALCAPSVSRSSDLPSLPPLRTNEGTSQTPTLYHPRAPPAWQITPPVTAAAAAVVATTAAIHCDTGFLSPRYLPYVQEQRSTKSIAHYTPGYETPRRSSSTPAHISACSSAIIIFYPPVVTRAETLFPSPSRANIYIRLPAA